MGTDDAHADSFASGVMETLDAVEADSPTVRTEVFVLQEPAAPHAWAFTRFVPGGNSFHGEPLLMDTKEHLYTPNIHTPTRKNKGLRS